MKISLVVFAAFIGMSGLAHAHAEGNGPCAPLRKACKAAGFKFKGHKDGDKDLVKDCMNPIMAGHTVANVTLPDAKDIDACKAHMGLK